MKHLNGLEPLVSRYDAFLIDQWGVLHDGNRLFAGVKQSLELLRRRGKRVVIATNSSKSAERNRVRLHQRFGIEPSLYSSIVSSAELLLTELSVECSTLSRFFVIADAGDEVLLSRLAHRQARELDAADSIVLLSMDPQADTAPIKALLHAAAARGLPLLTPSRDAATVTVHGVFTGLGNLATFYERAGGHVINFGKPELSFYAAARAALGAATVGVAVLAIGDQLDSDIVGAAREGFDSVLVRTGAGAFVDPIGVMPSKQPTYLLDSLRP